MRIAVTGMALASDIPSIYDEVASDFDRVRRRDLMERPYLERVLAVVPGGGTVLDLGCGSGTPIAAYFSAAGCRVTGVDAAPAMIAIARARYPDAEWLVGDMRTLALDRRFDAIVAWDSFFHLPQDDQRRMFAVFERHAAANAALLFTSGTEDGVAIGDCFGRPLFHASLATEEYARLLMAHGFSALLHRVADPDCGQHTIWLAQRRAGAV